MCFPLLHVTELLFHQVPTSFEPKMNREYRKVCLFHKISAMSCLISLLYGSRLACARVCSSPQSGTETLFAQAYKKAKLNREESVTFPVSTTFLTTGYTGPEMAGVERIAGGVMDKVRATCLRACV